MSVAIRPTGHKVLVKPDAAPDTSAGGLVVPESARREPAMSGVVVAVGDGPASAHRVRAATITACVDRIVRLDDSDDDGICEGLACALESLRSFAAACTDLSEVHPGDRVCFPYTAGQRLQVDEETYFVMQEDDITAVLETAEDTHG